MNLSELITGVKNLSHEVHAFNDSAGRYNKTPPFLSRRPPSALTDDVWLRSEWFPRSKRYKPDVRTVRTGGKQMRRKQPARKRRDEANWDEEQQAGSIAKLRRTTVSSIHEDELVLWVWSGDAGISGIVEIIHYSPVWGSVCKNTDNNNQQ